MWPKTAHSNQSITATKRHTMNTQRRGHPFLNAVAFVFSLFCLGVVALTYLVLLATHDDTPVPRAWNPSLPFSINDPLTFMTPYKLARALRNDALCLATLDEGRVMFEAMEPLEASEQCHVRNRVELTKLGQTTIAPVETHCSTALRLAMWERHDVQKAALVHFGQGVSRMRQIGSYSCRTIRGVSDRMSTHATAQAIDIGGFTLADGTRIELTQDWDGPQDRQNFLRDVRNGACRWFETTLGPDFNALHADHFHLQSKGWGTCR